MQWRNVSNYLKSPDGKTRLKLQAYLLLIGVVSLVVRILMHYGFHTSALLYVGLPYLAATAIIFLMPLSPVEGLGRQYLRHCVSALVVFFASSIVLFEGFVCVVMFMPIYYAMVSVVFLLRYLIARSTTRRGRTLVSILPVLMILSSGEGISERVSFDRHNRVVVTRVTQLPPEQVMVNIAQPFDLRKDRSWLLSVFPMPYEIDAESLQPGDIHRVRTRYHRWFFTNTHEGETSLEIVEVSPDRVKTRFIEDSSYFSSYLEPIGTEITLRTLEDSTTEITLEFEYRRKLDPAWYFHPLQQYAVGQMAAFLIEEVMIRGY